MILSNDFSIYSLLGLKGGLGDLAAGFLDQSFARAFHDRLAFFVRLEGEVVEFHRVGVVVVQFDSVLAFPPVRISQRSVRILRPMTGSGRRLSRRDLGNGLSSHLAMGFFNRGTGVLRRLEEWGCPRGRSGLGRRPRTRRRRQACPLPLAPGALIMRGARAPCSKRSLLPDSIVFTQVVAMVAPKYYDCVLP